MPTLKQEPDIFPEDLLEPKTDSSETPKQWWAAYTLTRREKDFMRKIRAHEIGFYGPTIEKRYKSPAGRIRTSFIPLFSNYVFVYADEDERIKCLETNTLSSIKPIVDIEVFLHELRQIKKAIASKAELLPETKIEVGEKVRVLNGAFKGYEGLVVRREGKTRLLLSLQFLEQGVSIELDQCQLAPLNG